MPMKLRDMTRPVPRVREKGVGSVRWQKPVWRDYLPPCNQACPAGENIQGWLSHAQAGDYEKAWQTLTEDNLMPAVHGRACYHPCESHCNRGELDDAVSIHAVERFLGDQATAAGWVFEQKPATGKRVLVIGAGPAGLACAGHLARMGHEVEIRDAAASPGGMLAHGIPAWRLPRETVQKDVERITAMRGVTLRCGVKVTDVRAAQAEGGFDAVFVGVGAGLANHLHLSADDGSRILDATTLLGDVSQNQKPALGRVVAVVGGGNVAMDAARAAQRLGAKETVLIFRYDQAHMEALPAEAQEAFAEGVKIRWLSVVDHFGADGLIVEEVTMNPDGSVTPTGKTTQLAADSLVMAVGEHSDLSLFSTVPDVVIQPDDTVKVSAETMMTDHAGIFAGGDCVGGARTMTTATGHGKRAARAIDAYLAGKTWVHPEKHPVVTFDMLNLPDYCSAPRSQQPERALSDRAGFDEVTGGLDEKTARYEAGRCLSCGNCFECDNCYAACPAQAITRIGKGHGYSVSSDLCTGCAACVEQCPCHAIEMTPDPAAEAGADVKGNLGEPVVPAGFRVRA